MQTEEQPKVLSRQNGADKALRDSELRYRRLFETAKDGILILDAETGMIEDVNPYLIDLLAIPKEQILRKKVWELGSFRNVIANHEKFLELQQKEYVRYDDLPLESSNGRKIDVEFVSNVYLVSGVRVIQCNIRNITERRRAERALRLSEFSVGSASVPTYWIARDAHIMRVNRAACDQLGYTEVELLALSLTDLEPESQAEKWSEHWQQLREQKRICFETLHRCKDGRTFPVEVEFNWLEFDGQEYNFVFAHDITERKKAEDEQRRSENQFRAIFEQAGIGIALVGVTDGRIIKCNRALEEMLGYSMDEMVRLTVKEISQDGEYLEEQGKWENLVAGKIVRYQMEKRYLRKDGQSIWGLLTVSIVRDAEGTPLFLIGMVEVITERKLAQAALETSEAHYRTMLKGLEAGVIVHGADSHITAFNAKAAELLGVTEAQMSTRAPFEVHWSRVRSDGSPFPEDELPYFLARATRQPVRNVIVGVNRPLSGDLIWLLVNANPILTEKGEIAEVIETFMDATAQIDAKRELKESANFTEDVLNSLTAQVVVLDGQGTIIAINDAWRRYLQESHANAPDLLGCDYIAVCRESFMRENAGGADEMAAGIRAVLAGESSDFELDYRSGGPARNRWFRMRVSPLTAGRRGVVVSHHDISEHRLAMEALRASKGRFEALFKQAAVGVAQADATSGRFVQVNQRFCEIVGRSQQGLSELTFSAITHPLDLDRDRETFAKLKAGVIREFTNEKRYIRSDQSEVWVNLTVSAMWAPGDTPDYVIAIVQDITKRKLLEEQFRQAQKMEAIGTLAGGIAHDFNNSLTVINGFAELAQMKLKGDSEIGECLVAVRLAASRAGDLVRQILTFSRQQPLERRPIQLQPVVDETLKLLRATIPSTIEFDIALAADAPTVLADSTQIHQILMNLGTNAWHSMRNQTGRLIVSLERCVVGSRDAGAEIQGPLPGVYARLSVSDTGCGMDETTLKRMFEPFFTTKPAGEGTGLGLAVVHGIMDTHDGSITAFSHPGEGTIFHLYFPAYAGRADLAAVEVGPIPRGHGEKILFVDDEELLVQMGKRALAMIGYDVDVATRPEEAVALVRADPQRFALVLTDQTMPGMTGMALAQQLRLIKPDLPIILSTGNSILLTPERLKTAGVCQLLLKPTTLRSLADAVHDALLALPARS